MVGSDHVFSSYPKVETSTVYAGNSSFILGIFHVLKALKSIFWWELIAAVKGFVSL